MSSTPRTLAEAAARCGAELRGAADHPVRGVAGLAEADDGQISFFSNRSYRRKLAASRAAAVIVSEEDASLPELTGKTLLVSDQPYAAFARLAQAFHPRVQPPAGIHRQACVEEGAEVDPSATVEAFVFVGRGARVSAGVHLMPGAYVGAGASIGEGSLLHPAAVVREHCVVGARCILQPGAVVGSDGFGFAFDPEGDGEGPVHRKIPQVGIARLEDDVELGANACVDRATMGETVVGRGAKIDNLVQIAHNVRVGPLTVMAAQVGIAGSTEIGAGVQMGGQAGVAGHIEIGDFSKVGAQAGVAQSVPAGSTVHGFPAMEAKGWLRASLLFARLPELARDLRALAKRVATLEKSDLPR